MYIYHALINVLSAHMIHLNLHAIFLNWLHKDIQGADRRLSQLSVLRCLSRDHVIPFIILATVFTNGFLIATPI